MDEAKGAIRTIATAEDPQLVRCFRGHEKTVTAVKFSKEMKQVVSGGSDGIVQVWNFKPQIRPFKFVGHKGQVNDVIINADSTKVISCGDDREIKIWKNSVNGKNKSVKAHTGPILKIALSQQEDFLVSCSSDKTIKMWNLEGKFKHSFLGHTNWVRECQISYDERLLLSCSDDRSVRLWDINKAVTSATFMEHKSEVLSCKFTPDGTCIAASAIDGSIKLWDTRLGKLIQHYNAHDGAVNRIAFHPLGYHMASVSNDNKIKIWDLKHGRLGWTVYGHEGDIKTIDFNHQGDYFATGAEDKLVMIWMTNFDKEINENGRVIESNFKTKSNGEGLQPLFKSNKLGKEGSTANLAETKEEAESESRRPKPNSKSQMIAQVMSFQLQKIVNQLQVVTRSLDFMDRHVTQHEQILEKLYNNERVDDVMLEMESKGFMKPEIYNSVWEADNNLQEKAEEEEELDLANDEDEYERFMREEEMKMKEFKHHLGTDNDPEFKEEEIVADMGENMF